MSNDFSPREIVSELDKHIVGQQDAKREVAIALRNRWRRLQLTGSLREEVLPNTLGKVAGVEYAVTGTTALDKDWESKMKTSAPLVFG